MHLTLLYKYPLASAGGPITIETPPFDTGDSAAVLVTLQVHSIVAGANVVAQMQMSGDGEQYTPVGAPRTLLAFGFDSGAIVAITTPYQRFMRGSVTLAPADMNAVVSLYVSLLPST